MVDAKGLAKTVSNLRSEEDCNVSGINSFDKDLSDSESGSLQPLVQILLRLKVLKDHSKKLSQEGNRQTACW